MKITFVGWIRDQIGTFAEFGFYFSCGRLKTYTIEVFLKEINRTSISHFKSCVSFDLSAIQLFRRQNEQQILTMSSRNVLSFFSFENSTHNRLSHSLPSSADGVEVKIQTRISKLFFADFRCLIFSQMNSHLLNMVSHPSNFSESIAENQC